MTTTIPEKIFFKIGEVAIIASLKPSVLRFWETEFVSLKPKKSRSGQRLYTRSDLDRVLEIKKLLYEEKLTIKGAKNKLENNIVEEHIIEHMSLSELTDIVCEIKRELQQLIYEINIV